MNKIKIAIKGIIIYQSKFLIVKDTSLDKTGKKYEWWGIPGGKPEKGENPKETLLREIKEETNLDVQIVKILDCYSGFGKIDQQYFITVYLCKTKNNAIDLNKNPAKDEELLEFKWVTKEEFLTGAYFVKTQALKNIVRDLEF